MVDRWDRLWVATYQGLYCFFNRSFTNHQLSDENDIVRAVAIDAQQRVVKGTLNGKLMVGDSLIDDHPEQFYASSAVRIGRSIYMAGKGDVACITNVSIRCLHLPRDRYQFVGQAWGKLITGTRNSIFAYAPATATLDTLTSEILHPWCSACDGDGLLWIGSSSGLFSIDRQHHLNKTTYLNQKLIISAMDRDEQGHVFFASADSVFVVRRGQVESLNLQMPLLSGHEVRSLHVSPQAIWW